MPFAPKHVIWHAHNPVYFENVATYLHTLSISYRENLNFMVQVIHEIQKQPGLDQNAYRSLDLLAADSLALVGHLENNGELIESTIQEVKV